MFAVAPGWECDVCEIRNKPEATKCAACETPNPNAVQSNDQPAADATKPTFTFGAPASNVTFGAASAGAAAQQFSFGAQPSAAPTTFSFGAPAASSSSGAAPTFTFGTK